MERDTASRPPSRQHRRNAALVWPPVRGAGAGELDSRGGEPADEAPGLLFHPDRRRPDGVGTAVPSRWTLAASRDRGQHARSPACLRRRSSRHRRTPSSRRRRAMGNLAFITFAVFLTVSLYALSRRAFLRYGYPLLSPVFLSTLVIIAVLTACGIPFAGYK